MSEYSVIKANRETITVAGPGAFGKELTWGELSAAARHEDPRVAAVYAELLREAQDVYSARVLLREDRGEFSQALTGEPRPTAEELAEARKIRLLLDTPSVRRV